MPTLWAELKRRNVFRVGVAYLALAWVVIQFTDLAVPALNLPDSLHSIVFYIGVIGFPFALFFAWAFELTPEGIKREHEVDRSASVTHLTGRKLDLAIIAMLVIAIGFLVVDNYVLDGSGDAAIATEHAKDLTDDQRNAYESIGVLPFTNMSNDPDQEYFSDGMAEELLNALAKLQNLRVAARTSSFAFKGQNKDITEIGKTLKVDTVLEGSVRKSGTRLRITAQLIDVSNGYHLWSETYDRELTDVFSIQDDLTAAIVDALKVHLAVGETVERSAGVANWEAYDAYLKGLHATRRRTDESIAAAIAYFEEAVRLDPKFAAALAQQAQAVLLSVSYGGASREEVTAMGKRLLARALELDPDLAEGYAARGYLAMDAGDCEGALPDFEVARRLNPNLVEALHWSCLCLIRQYRLAEALQLEQRAHQLDPLHASVFSVLADFKTRYGMEVELNLDAAGANNPQRLMDYQYDLLFGEKKWAEVIVLAAQQENPDESNFKVAIAKMFLAEEDSVLFERTAAGFGVRAHEFLLSSLLIFDRFDAMATQLATLTEADFSFSTFDAWLGYTEYSRGKLDQAQVLLAQAQTRTDNWFDPSHQLSNLNLTLSLADTLIRRGDRESAGVYLQQVRAAINSLKRNGARKSYQLPEARLSVMKGDFDTAVTLLEQADNNGDVIWSELDGPILSQLDEHPDFIAFKSSFYQHLNSQRASLGWPPVSQKPTP